MWHASVFAQRGQPNRKGQTRRARQLLQGVGDPAHEWVEWTGRCVHLRLRLTPTEQQAVGAVLDVRGTPEAQRRYVTMVPFLHGVALQVALDEMRRP